MTDQSSTHDVRYDFAGFFGNHPRLTCYSPGCGQATLTAQPYMTQEVFDEKVREFIRAHTPADGIILDYYRLRPPLSVEELLSQ